MNDNTIAPPVYYETTNSAASAASTVTPSSVPGHFGGALETTNNFSLSQLFQMGVVYAFIIAAALSAIFIFVGGVSFILSGGNDEKIKKAINTIRFAIVGLIITILSFTFVMIIGRIFGLNLMDYLSYTQIKNSINQIVSGAKSAVGTPVQPQTSTSPLQSQ